jgi:preprotein translocase subunit YajC
MTTFLSSLPLLQAASGGGNQMITMVVTFGLIIVIFYFLIIRPQRKKQKETKDMLSTLRPGDRVATAGGIRGVVKHVKENTVTIKVDDNTKIEFNKSAVSSVLERKESKEIAEDTEE